MLERAPARLAAFAVVLLAAFGAAFGLGRAIGPIGDDGDRPSSTPTSTTTTHDMGSHDEAPG